MIQKLEGKLRGKVALITGGNSGIGLATANQFLQEGADVVITASSSSSFEKAKKEVNPKINVIRADVTKLDEIRSLAEAVKDQYGEIDILFANAGIAHFAPLQEVTSDFFDKQFNTNVKGLLFTVQQFSPFIKKGGSVILTTSGVNTKGLPGSSVYAATKAAVRSMARTLSAELVSLGIRVNALSPGPVETPIYGKMNLSENELKGFANQIQASTPVGRFGSADEIAKAAVFLASDDSSFVLGAELVADGGFSQL